MDALPPTFFKYMPAGTGRIVLTNRTLRWSSPLMFNDPFDVPRELAGGLDPETINAAYTKEISGLLQDPPEDISIYNDVVRRLLEQAKAGRLKGAVKDELVALLLKPGAAKLAIGQGRALWQALVPQLRILCLTESPAHVAMWYHYADEYRGVVLEFRLPSSEQRPTLRPRRVNYPADLPDIYTHDGWGRLMTLGGGGAWSRAVQEMALFSKSTDWQYENEWRLVGSDAAGNAEKLYSDWGFDPGNLVSINLGPLISSEDEAAVMALAAGYPGARVRRVSIGVQRAMTFADALVTSPAPSTGSA
ncbi:DUF2971 domain-containing protein [Mitsuaria sp. 7]|uniref:DUF2971 domain-containing protein n=1 Tax=Mitsuaria sp. 7 TaxID=1658665 RepID=UPI0018D40489|nr:DUF2971 domain-containing protein [Mitsuaria sp. 7]